MTRNEIEEVVRSARVEIVNDENDGQSLRFFPFGEPGTSFQVGGQYTAPIADDEPDPCGVREEWNACADEAFRIWNALDALPPKRVRWEPPHWLIIDGARHDLHMLAFAQIGAYQCLHRHGLLEALYARAAAAGGTA